LYPPTPKEASSIFKSREVDAQKGDWLF